MRSAAARTLLLALLPVLWGGSAGLAQESIALRDALVVGRLGISGRVPFFTDPVARAMTLGGWQHPAEGDMLTLGEETGTWRAVSAEDDGWLRVPEMRGGHAAFTVESAADRVMILEAQGHSVVYVDGVPRTGDPYSNGLLHLPVLLGEGTTELLFKGGRGELRATLVEPAAALAFDTTDDTLPDAIEGEDTTLWAGIPLLNASNDTARGIVVRAIATGPAGEELVEETIIPSLVPLGVYKAPVRLPRGVPNAEGKITLRLEALREGSVLHTREVTLQSRKPTDKHVRTFVSGIDGSVQYFGITPMQRDPAAPPLGHPPALFLTLHGASVEGSGQANAYAHKDWGHIVAPTNRRPFGFDWEDWGRLDAVEVLDTAGQLFGTDPSRTYLTGHSMGGHGAWQVGVQFPDRFAAIAPSAGWVSFWSYGGLIEYGTGTPVRAAFTRAASPSDTLSLSDNYADEGVYILHGDADDNVPVEQARSMRSRLAEFHTNFAYYEQPGAGHWWGSACVDWPPLFDFLRANQRDEHADHIRFATANPGVSATYRWATILEQAEPMTPSRFDLTIDPAGNTVTGTTENVARLSLRLHETQRPVTRKDEAGNESQATVPDTNQPLKLTLDGQELGVNPWLAGEPIVLSRLDGAWRVEGKDELSRKGPHRSGPFKHAFANRAVLVYATGGDDAEDAWALAKARFDAETFKYRGNGAFLVVSDAEFQLSSTELGDPSRNVILYGNADTNLAWDIVLGGDGTLRIGRDGVALGGRSLTGDLGVLAIRPRAGSDSGAVGIVGGTTLGGCRATDRLPYFVSGVAYPDYTVVTPEVYESGIDAVTEAGYFDGAWRVVE